MYRDDLEAALARADAAERELAEAREADAEARAKLVAELAAARDELKRVKQDAPKARARARSPEAPTSTSTSTSSNKKAWVLGVGGVVAAAGLIAALMLGTRACERHRVLHGAGKLYAAHVMYTREGEPRLVAVSESLERGDESDVTPWRIDLLDPLTGKRLKRQVFFDGGRGRRPELMPATPGHMWCDLNGSYVGQRNLIELCDVATLGVAVSERQLLERNPSLASGFSSSAQIERVSAGLVATLNTGETILLDSPDLTMRPFQHDRAVHDLVGFGQSQYGTTSTTGEYGFKAVGGSRREGLFRDGATYGAEQRIGDQTFLDPALLRIYSEDHMAVLLPDDAGVIVVHRDSLDNHTARVLVSRLGLDDGQPRWTLTEPAGTMKLGFLIGDLVIYALEVLADTSSLIVGVDWKDGTVRWRYAM